MPLGYANITVASANARPGIAKTTIETKRRVIILARLVLYKPVVFPINSTSPNLTPQKHSLPWKCDYPLCSITPLSTGNASAQKPQSQMALQDLIHSSLPKWRQGHTYAHACMQQTCPCGRAKIEKSIFWDTEKKKGFMGNFKSRKFSRNTPPE
jgi:hypothetical protein